MSEAPAKPKPAEKTVDQQIATLEQKLAALKAEKDKLDARQKIIVGAVVIKEALENPKVAVSIWKLLNDKIQKPRDREQMAEILEAIRKKGIEFNPPTSGVSRSV